MFRASDVAFACGVEQVTMRGWQSRAPGFTMGSRDGRMKKFTPDEALGLVITAEIIRRGLALPSIALPTAMRIARDRRGQSIWISGAQTGELRVTDSQPSEPAVFLPLATLADRLTRVAGDRRIERQTR